MLKIPATLTKISSLEDRSFKITMTTQELSDEQGSELIKLNGRFGNMVFSESPIQASDIPEFDPSTVDSKKSPSERLRAVLYVRWDRNTSKTRTFDEYYVAYMSQLIDKIKDTIN